MGTSNSGGGSNFLRRVAMAIYGRQKNQFMDFTFHFMDRVSFSTVFWRSGESMNDLNGKLQSIATGIEGLVCSKSSPYKLCTTSPIKLYHERVSRTGSVFPIFWGYKLIDKPVQNLYGLVLQSRPHSIPVAIDCIC